MLHHNCRPWHPRRKCITNAAPVEKVKRKRKTQRQIPTSFDRPAGLGSQLATRFSSRLTRDGSEKKAGDEGIVWTPSAAAGGREAARVTSSIVAWEILFGVWSLDPFPRSRLRPDSRMPRLFRSSLQYLAACAPRRMAFPACRLVGPKNRVGGISDRALWGPPVAPGPGTTPVSPTELVGFRD